MYKFSKISLHNLESCHLDLQLIAKEAIINSPYDFRIIHGHRTSEQQFELYKKGREFKSGQWIQTGKVVTYVDGFIKKSKHNYEPSLAFDIAILKDGQITWYIPYYVELQGHILNIADELFEQNKIQNRLNYGGNWIKFKDYCHFQI